MDDTAPRRALQPETMLRRFERDIQGLHSVDDLVASLDHALKSIGFAAFVYGYGRFSETGGLLAHGIWSTLDPDWIGLYAAQRYYRDDRLVREALATTAAFRYEEIFSTPPNSSRQQEMEQRFGYTSGVVVPIHGPGPRGYFGILSAAAPRVARPPPIDSDAVAAVQYLANVFHHRVRRLNLPNMPNVLEIPPIVLTAREKQCLVWASAGKTNHDIGVLLELSARTAKKHIESAMRKLDATNRAQAVAKATALGLIEA